MTSRKQEVHTTQRVIRSSNRAVSPHNVGQLDNNLDNLLEDLQNSVSRPGSSLGVNGSGLHSGNYREYTTRNVSTSSGSGSLGRSGANESRVEYLSAANPITVPSESSTTVITEKAKEKDGTKEKTVYKTIKYEYDVSDSISPERSTRMQSNINQLDNLLDDLQQARKGANINAGIDPGLLEPLDSTSGGTSRQVTKKTVQRELLYGSPDQQSAVRGSRPRQQSPSSVRRSDREGSVTREVTYRIDDGTYGDIRTTRQASPIRTTSPYRSDGNSIQKTTNVRTYNYNTDVVSPSYGSPTTKNITSTEEVINPAILSDLDPNLLPNPSTKVTTTIKTYTYELPGTAVVPNTGYPSRVQSPIDPDRLVYNVSPNPTINRNETYVYKNENYNTSTHSGNTGYPNSGYPVSGPPHSGTTNYIYKEDIHTTNKYNEPIHPQQSNPPNSYPGSQRGPPGNQTIIYKEDIHTTNKYGGPNVPPNQPHQNYPPGSNTTIIHKTDRYNTNYGGYPPNDKNPNNNLNNYPSDGHPPYPGKPNPNVDITYKYTTHHTTSNNYRGYPPGSPIDDREPLLQPGRFPTEPSDHYPANTGPPKQVDDLMASLNGTDHTTTTHVYNTTSYTNKANGGPKEPNWTQKSTTTASSPTPVVEVQQKKDIKDLPKSKNVAGPPVYYPPGHEMFAKKEESAAGYSAEGGYMRASGKYKYEAESKSKSKSSSGAAVVPVCLPLCCAMPCVLL